MENHYNQMTLGMLKYNLLKVSIYLRSNNSTRMYHYLKQRFQIIVEPWMIEQRNVFALYFAIQHAHAQYLKFIVLLRIKIVSEGKKRKLVISDTLRSDGGEISVKTNTETSKCNLRVAYANKFITGMSPKMTAVEREPMTTTVEVKVCAG